MIIVVAVYGFFIVFWFWFLITRNAFKKNTFKGWAAAIAASICWPLGFLLVGFAPKQSNNYKICNK